MLSKIRNKEDIIKLFPKNKEAIKNLVNTCIEEAKRKIEKIISIDSQARTFENTAHQLDEISSLSNLSIIFSGLNALEMLSPDKEIRETAQAEIINIQKFWVEQISNNKKLYKAFREYDKIFSQEDLSEEQQYFIQETLQDYTRAGLDLPEEKLEKVKQLNKELGKLGLKFETNIAADQTKLFFKQEDLAGVNKEFINALEKNSAGEFVVGVDYPTYFTIMANCSIGETRKKLYIAFNNRAYPENKEILQEIIKKRDELSKLLGFKSYAHLDLNSQMAKNPETAKSFLLLLYKKADKKVNQEFDILSKKLTPFC